MATDPLASRAQPKAGTKATIKAIGDLSPRLRGILAAFPEEYKFGKLGSAWYLFAGCNPNDPREGSSEGGLGLPGGGDRVRP